MTIGRFEQFADPCAGWATAAIQDASKGAFGLTAEHLRGLLHERQTSTFCQDHDLIDPITLLIATGLRRTELQRLRWIDYDDEASTATVTGRVISVSGEGLQRVDETKSAAGPAHSAISPVRRRDAAEPARPALSRATDGDLAVDAWHTSGTPFRTQTAATTTAKIVRKDVEPRGEITVHHVRFG